MFIPRLTAGKSVHMFAEGNAKQIVVARNPQRKLLIFM